jgi:hypothetical protein
MRTALDSHVPIDISRRDLQLLQAVADGRVSCTRSVEPDFFVDGVPCCDHLAARALARAGMVRTADLRAGLHLPVQLTSAGRDALATAD